MDDRGLEAHRSELANGLRNHYQKASSAIHEWHNQIPVAIDLWEQWPERQAENHALRQERDALQAVVDELRDALIGMLEIDGIDHDSPQVFEANAALAKVDGCSPRS